jgi:hypothetical protein
MPYNDNLPNEILKVIKEALRNPFSEPLNKLVEYFQAVDNNRGLAINKAVECGIAYGIAHIENNKGNHIDIAKLARSYFLDIDNSTVEKITNKFRNRIGV